VLTESPTECTPRVHVPQWRSPRGGSWWWCLPGGRPWRPWRLRAQHHRRGLLPHPGRRQLKPRPGAAQWSRGGHGGGTTRRRRSRGAARAPDGGRPSASHSNLVRFDKDSQTGPAAPPAAGRKRHDAGRSRWRRQQCTASLLTTPITTGTCLCAYPAEVYLVFFPLASERETGLESLLRARISTPSVVAVGGERSPTAALMQPSF
jgi:hypothetical protein